eukprot:824479-Karenia_brevis.AAC.1
MLEYFDLIARVTLADADTTDYFPFSKGGRQGGVETPELFNIIVESAVVDVVEKWRAENYGFTLDGVNF